MSHSHKRGFKTKEEIEKNIAETKSDVKIYPYLCDCGLWHKTKQSPEGRRKWLESLDQQKLV